MSDLENKVNEMIETFNQIKRICREKDRNLYEQWKAGGFLIDDNIVSMYPSIYEVFEAISCEDEE